MKKPQNRPAEAGATTSRLSMAIAEFNTGQREAAYASLVAILETDPHQPEALLHLGFIALSANLSEDARVFFDHAIQSSDTPADLQLRIAQHCMDAGQVACAEPFFLAACHAEPAQMRAVIGLAAVWQQQGRVAEALQLLTEVSAANPAAAPELLPAMLQLAHLSGDLETEYALCLRAGDDAKTQARAIELLTWLDDRTANDRQQLIARFCAVHDRAPGALAAGPRQRLRIGFVIGKLASDDVRYRIEPLMRQLDHARFETLVLATDDYKGEHAQRLYLIADHWCALAGLDPDTMTQRLRALNIDLLINVEGYACASSLLPFTARLAPLQINWSNPPLATGLQHMDYLLHEAGYAVERDPASAGEKLVALPIPVSYDFPPIHATTLPLATHKPAFTFGCLTAVALISSKTWLAWAEILQRTPAARLLLHAAELGAPARRRVIKIMADLGVAEERLLWTMDAVSARSCDLWPRIDAGLCPLTGDSQASALLGLWLGIPSIACMNPEGDASVNRLPLLIDDTPQHYVELATQLATGEVKAPAIATGPSTAAFAQAFGQTLKMLWQRAGGTLERLP